MNIRAKYAAIKNKVHLKRIKWNNRKNNFQYDGDMLSDVVKIKVANGGKCKIRNIWAGAGEVSISVFDQGELSIGKDVCINSNVMVLCRKKIHIGNDVMFGPNIVVIDHDHDYRDSNWKDAYISDDIYIGNNVWIGANVVILRGSHIGDNSVVGAGMVVKGKLDANTVYYCQDKIMKKEF